MAKKFQNLTIDYKDLIGKMTIGDRVSMLRSNEGRQLLSSLTPYQLAEMFPDYYKERYPDVGKILKSISDPSFKGREYTREEADEEMQRGAARIISGERRAQPEARPAWLRKIEEETGKKISDPGAKIQLSDAKKQLLKEMETSGVKSDDPRAKFLSNLSDDDLKKAGISKQTDSQGNIVYRRAEISQAEIQEEAAKMAAAGATKVISAGEGQPTVVEYADGRIEKRTGDRGWRNNNPGNIEYGTFARSMGAIGSDGRFAIFPTPEMGREAKDNLLFESQSYRGMSIEKAIEKYAPRTENDTDAYIKKITDALGVPKNTSLSQLSLDQRKVLLDVVKKTEGRSTGNVEVLRQGIGLANVQPLTEQQLAQVTERIRERQEGFVAKKSIPDLPNGLDAGVVSFYNKLDDRQKLDFHDMILASSGGNTDQQIAEGVKKINNVYQRNPGQVASLITKTAVDASGKLVSTEWKTFEGAETGPKAAEKLGISAPANAGSSMFAADPQGRNMVTVRTKSGATFQVNKELEGNFKGLLRELESRGYYINPGNLGAGGFNYRPKMGAAGLSEHSFGSAIDINPGASENTDRKLHGEKLAGKNNLPPDIAMIAKRYGFSWGGLWDRQDTMHFEYHPSHGVAPTKDVTAFDQTYRAEVEANPQIHSNAKLFIENQPSQVAQQQTVPVYAVGGTHNLNTDEIKAMPIDSLKGDNSVVVDKSNNPLFTMNTKEEQAVYDPKTRQVDIQPLAKTNPNTLGEKQTTEKLSDTENTTLKENQPPPVMPQSGMPQSGLRSSDTSLTITDDIFKDPSFKRAIAKTRFVDTGDAALGGHFGMANADLG